MESFREILRQWPTLAQLARDIGASYDVVKKWNQNDTIPSPYWLAVVQAAHRRGIMVSLEDLAAIQKERAA